MRNSPTWRLDVLGDSLIDLQRAQQHAAVVLFRELSRKNPEAGLERQLQGVRRACEQLGLVLSPRLGSGRRCAYSPRGERFTLIPHPRTGAQVASPTSPALPKGFASIRRLRTRQSSTLSPPA